MSRVDQYGHGYMNNHIGWWGVQDTGKKMGIEAAKKWSKERYHKTHTHKQDNKDMGDPGG